MGKAGPAAWASLVAAALRSGQLPILALAGCAAFAAGARAQALGQLDGFDLRLNTTVRVSVGFRTEDADPALLANVNADDGDRAFRPGPISERVDVVSELTGERGDLGFDVSGQGWYDAAYNTRNADTSPATYNPVNSSYSGFAPDVRTLMGRQAELLNAYVRDSEQIGDVPVTVSIGRQTLLWGESLLFPENGIAAAQAPVDEIKSLGAPLAEARELFLPVTQAVVRVGLGDGLSVEIYDQLEWRPNRLPGVGSFFSTTDLLDQGGQRYLAVDGTPTLYRGADSVPHGIGQAGIALRETSGGLDWGIYALRADARAPVLVLDVPQYLYTLAYPRGIGVFGGSVSGYVGAANIAGEVSVHDHTPLDAAARLAGASFSGSGGGGVYDGAVTRVRPVFSPDFVSVPVARGTTLNAQTSISAELPAGRFSSGTILQAELAGNSLLAGSVPAGRTAFAVAMRGVMTLQYFHVARGVDLAVPLGVGLGVLGRSSVDASQNAGTGFLSAGVTANFHVVWQGSLSFTHFMGGAGAQPLADRDFATLSVTRSF